MSRWGFTEVNWRIGINGKGKYLAQYNEPEGDERFKDYWHTYEECKTLDQARELIVAEKTEIKKNLHEQALCKVVKVLEEYPII